MGTGILDSRGGATKGFRRQSDELFRAQFEERRPFLASQNPFLDVLNGANPFDASPSSTSTSTSTDGDSRDDTFSDLALTYISQALMDDDDKVDNSRECDAALRAAEKPFYDILGQKYPPSPVRPPLDSPDNGNSSGGPSSNSSSSSGGGGGGGGVANGISHHHFPERYLPFAYPTPVGCSSLPSIWEVQEDYLDGLSDLFHESEPPAWQFRSGESEKEERDYLYPSYESRGQKNQHSEDDSDFAEERRATKQPAVSSDDGDLRTGMLDDALLCKGDHFVSTIEDIRESLHILPKSSSRSKGRRGKKQPEKEVVDLRTILTQCAQMVAADDRRGASELLKQIRLNSSDVGDGTQRLAHYFANGLEARLAGTGSEIYNPIKQKRRTATDHLKVYQLYLAVCPIKRISYFYSNQHILDAAENATRIHVVDFGISFGFQWPSLIQRLSRRAGGAPALRITGIDFPQPGFRPSERLDETGLRLTEYAWDFGVPFEYRGICSRWEDVRVEDLGIAEDDEEVLVVNCLYAFRYLADETVAAVGGSCCPRDAVLNTIREMKPDVFIHGVVNGSHSAPFFITRFREALFFFSAVFDVFETNVPREDERRLVSEREIFGQEILNIVACEGSERVERPETYRQWQVRNLRAGFAQRPLNREMVRKAKDMLRGCYHQDFLLDEDGKWLLQGWKGRILFALSTWKLR
ncbi:scarecrow-like protein 9 [Iris pallida]|uniref:Scarecrow-like protein 9 n=1 Tax=Iris pallida TaxID=29817 RepID=A0AAX6EG90_IRIPA|nr:scarecrow-like protein 9 [Iris pallida]